MNAKRALAAIGLLWIAAPSAADLLVPVAQARSVTARASHPSGTPSYESIAAPDFTPFTANASASSGTTGFDSASSSQDSTIGARGIDGHCTVWSLIDRPEQIGTAQATCIIDVTFDVTETVAYRLNLSFSYGPNARSEDELILSGTDGVIHSSSGPTDQRGALAPGRYRLQSTAIQNPSFGAPYQYTLSNTLAFELTAPRQYTLTGKFTSHHGQLIDLPLVGNAPCPSLTLMSGPGGPIPMPTTPPARTMTRANAFGCAGAAPVQVATTGIGVGGAFTLATDALVQPPPQSVRWLHVPNATPVSQVQTSLAFAGPTAKAPCARARGRTSPVERRASPGASAIHRAQRRRTDRSTRS
jgi:hypothetical protein